MILIPYLGPQCLAEDLNKSNLLDLHLMNENQAHLPPGLNAVKGIS